MYVVDIKEKCKDYYDDYKWVILIFIVSLLLSHPLFHNGYFLSDEHATIILRTMDFEAAVQSGQFPVKILPNFANGFGYGWHIFYPPLSYQATWSIYKLGFSYVNSAKLVNFLSLFLSGFTMFFFVKRVFKNNLTALFSAILYISGLYRKLDMFSRNAYSESFAFIFIPLAFYGLYKIMHEDHKEIGMLSLAVAGLALTHNITAFYTCFFLAIVVLLNINIFIKAPMKIVSIAVAALICILISSYYTLPLLEHLLFEEYGVNMTNVMIAYQRGPYNHAVYPSQFLGLISSYGKTLAAELRYIAPYALLCIVISLAVVIIKRVKDRLIISLLIAGLVSVFMTLTIFPWRSVPRILLFVQFPWRLFLFSTFFFSIVIPTAFDNIKTARVKNSLMVLFVLFSIIMNMYLFNPKSYCIIEDSNAEFIGHRKSFNMTYFIEDSNYVKYVNSANLYDAFGEYLPMKILHGSPLYMTVRRFEDIETRDNTVIPLSGDVRIYEYKKSGSNLDFYLRTGMGDSLLELPFIYYRGYQALLYRDKSAKDSRGYQVLQYRDKSAKPEHIDVIEGPKGFASIVVKPNTVGKVTVSYEGTFITKLGVALTALGLALLIFWSNRGVILPRISSLRRQKTE